MAESPVDRSIDAPSAFIQTNLVGTFSMLGSALEYWWTLSPDSQGAFRFYHISRENFATGIEKTIRWYLDNEDWWHATRSGGDVS